MKIALTGKMRSGKDTLADVLNLYYHFEEFRFAAGITEIINQYFPEKSKEGKLREHYQMIGQSLRQLDPFIWVNYTHRMIEDFTRYSEGKSIVITDVRQPNEYMYAKQNGFTVIKVEADEDIRIKRIIDAGDMWHTNVLRHETENAVDDIPADITITNNGSLEEFRYAIERVLLLITQAELQGRSVESFFDENPFFFAGYNNIRTEHI